MALKYFLDRRHKNKNNQYTLRYHIYINKRQILYSTEINLDENQWNGREIINHPRSKNLNFYLSQNKNAVDLYLSTQEDTIVDRKQLTVIITNANSIAFNTRVEKVGVSTDNLATSSRPNDGNFIIFFQQFINKAKAHRTKEIYAGTISKLRKYDYSVDMLSFDDVNYKFLEAFDDFMISEGNSVNSRAIHFRNIRAVYNKAIDDDMVELNKYPFRKFKIKKERTRKRSLTIEQIQAIQNSKIPLFLEQYRELFFLIFYLIGINIVDLAHAKKKDVVNGYLEYKRHKTHRLYTVKLEPEAIDIINKYSGKKEYLIDVMDRYSDYSFFSGRLNRNLKKIFPQLTTYWARHSWATIASELEIPKETIAAALGHGGNEVTDIYINFNQKKIDEANRKVIDYINKYTTNNKNDEEDIIISA